MSDRCTTHSHPLCPTCQSDLSGVKELAYFASDSNVPLAHDDVTNLYEETSRLVHFLGALAQAGPAAAVQDHEAMRNDPPPDWLMYFKWLAEELGAETERRLLLLRQAGLIWQMRGEQTTTRKEG